MREHFAVAIDGPSGAGKSSLAKAAAARFGFIYVDTGAIYRTVGLAAYRAGRDTHDEAAVRSLLPDLEIALRYNGQGEQRMFLNGEDVSEDIRRPEISLAASNVSAHTSVRAFLMEMQRRCARESSVIMDGRDIGTVVLPDAEVKIFLTASSEARAHRRLLQLEEKGLKASFDDVLRDIELRDRQDTTRAAAPLKMAEDAVLLDTSEIDFAESLSRLCGIIESKLNIKAVTEK